MRALGRLALIVFAGLAASTPAAACDCPGEDPASALARADAVFEARVLSIGPSRWRGQPCGGVCPDTAVRMRVIRHWKGAPAREIVVHTDLTTDCGYEFAVEQSYLVYALRAGDVLHTSICTRTARIDRAADDLRVLGAGTAAAP